MPRFGALAGSPSLGALASRRGLPPGLVHGWSLDNTTSGYTDFARGLTLTQQGSGTSTAAGVIGDAASFNGSGWLQSGNVSLQQIGFAVESWAFTTTVAVGSAAVSTQDKTGSRAWILYRSSSSLVFYLNNTAGGGVFAEATGAFSVNTWVHVVGVITSDQRARIYTNGVLRNTSAILAGTPISTAQELTIGAGLFPGGESRWQGRLDEPRIWQFGAAGDPGAAFWAARHNGGLGRRP
jgi:hypothetical protein